MKIVEMNALSVKQTDPQKLGTIDIQPHYVSLSEIPSKNTLFLSPFCKGCCDVYPHIKTEYMRQEVKVNPTLTGS